MPTQTVLHASMFAPHGSPDTRTVAELLTALETPHWATRRKAAWELGRRQVRRAVKPLLTWLAQTRSAQSRNLILLVLGRIGDERAIDPLLRWLEDWNQAGTAALALSWFNNPRVLPSLRKGLHGSPSECCAVLEALGSRRDRASVDTIIGLTRHEHTSVRAAASAALRHFRGPTIRAALLERLEDPDPYVIREALRGLDPQDQQRAVPALVQILERRDRETVGLAALTLGELRAGAAVEPMVRVLRDRSSTNLARGDVVVPLGMIGDSMSLQPLLDALTDPSPTLRIAAIDGLGYLKDVSALPALEQIASSDSAVEQTGESVRNHARNAIRQLRRVARENRSRAAAAHRRR